MYFKILRDDLTHRGYVYHEGLNVDPMPFDSIVYSRKATPDFGLYSGKKQEHHGRGFHFVDETHLFDYNYVLTETLLFGYKYIVDSSASKIAEVEVPEMMPIIKDGYSYRAHQIVLGKIRDIWTIETFKWLSECKIDVSPALNYAVHIGYTDIVKYIVEQGADIHKDRCYILTSAAENGHFAIVQYLVEKDETIINENNNSALHKAVANGHLDIVKYLVEHGMDIHSKHDSFMFSSVINNDLDMVEYLINQGVCLDDNTFYLSVREGNLNMMKSLIDLGFDISGKYNKILMYAVSGGHLDIVEYLVKSGVDITTKKSEIVQEAAKNGHLNIIEYMDRMGIDVHEDDEKLLYLAAKNKRLDVVKYLLKDIESSYMKYKEVLCSICRERYKPVSEYIRSICFWECY